MSKGGLEVSLTFYMTTISNNIPNLIKGFKITIAYVYNIVFKQNWLLLLFRLLIYWLRMKLNQSAIKQCFITILYKKEFRPFIVSFKKVGYIFFFAI